MGTPLTSGTISNNNGLAVHTQTVFNQYEEGARNVTYVANETFGDIVDTLST